MKKILICIISFILILGTSALIIYSYQQKNQISNKFSDKKILIVYYSHSGNTKNIAKKIKILTNAEIFELIPSKPYPKDYSELTEFAQKEKASKQLVELKNQIDIAPYDVIFIGTPIWWGTMANPVESFVLKNDFKQKTIIPFVTHGGGGGYNIAGDIKRLAPTANVLEQLTIQGQENMRTQREIENWLSKINSKI